MQNELEHLERCYWALTSLARKLQLPSSLCRHQDWLAAHLTASEGLSGRWRRTLWKRIVDQIEREIAEGDLADEIELDERLIEALTTTLAAADAQLVRRRFIWHYGGERYETDIQETESFISSGTTGLRTWQAAICLANHLVAQPALIKGKDVVELGAGSGLVSLVAATLGAQSIYTTDSNEHVLTALEVNRQLNRGASAAIHVKKLDWSEADDFEDHKASCDIILGADIVFDSALVDDLVKCLSALLSRPSSLALIVSTVRDEATWNSFIAALEAQQLTFERVEMLEPAKGQELLGGHDEDTQTGTHVVCLQIHRPDG